MLNTLGPLGAQLTQAGFHLIAPNGPVQMTDQQVRATVSWLSKGYTARGQDIHAVFREGGFWSNGEHYEWFDARRNNETRTWTYHALLESIAVIRDAVNTEPVIGVLGFSQGCAMAAVAAALAVRGVLPFGDTLRFAVLLSGFQPHFQKPEMELWPVADLPALIIGGTDDAVFPDPKGLIQLQAAFPASVMHLVAGLQHTVPDDPEWVARITRFAVEHSSMGSR